MTTSEFGIIEKIELPLLDNKFPKECKISIKWLIKEKDLFEAKPFQILYDEVYSASKIPAVDYLLGILPNGIKNYSTNIVGIYLGMENKRTKKIQAHMKVTVQSASKTNEDIHIYDKSSAMGLKLCTREELFDPKNKFFINGILTIEFEAILKPQQITRKPLSHELNVFSKELLWISPLLLDREKEEDKDIITIFVESQSIMIHKSVLISHSPVFDAMFKSGMKEAKEKQVNIIDFKANIIKIAIEFCYEINIIPFINDENIYDLLAFADKYFMDDMKDIIEAEMIENLNESNACLYANISIIYNCKNLKEFCICFLAKFFDPPATTFFNDDIDILDDEIKKEIEERKGDHHVDEKVEFYN